MMPQWDFLDFVADEARTYPNFSLAMNAEATGLIEEGDRIVGVRVERDGANDEIHARLVIVADGRGSALRQLAGFHPVPLGAPMDVFWFRIQKPVERETGVAGFLRSGRILVLLDRGTYWQCAYLFPKGGADDVRARGLDVFRKEIGQVAPLLATGVDAIASWDDVKLLTVALDRLERWNRPGLLVIGDAAHAMSPIGGVGINVAIQDAVAAANLLARPMAAGRDVDALLERVEKRRRLAVRAIQGFQNAAQQRIIRPLLAGNGPVKAPWVARLLDRFPPLRRLPAAFLGFGIRPEHIRSPSVRPERG
jgi:2-polyprenyl-6-methoxyphenol hydroxylase-like FAD-dependent oxidoreductase